MTPERRLADNLRRMMPEQISIVQGIVTAVDDLTCTVEIGDASIGGVRLRASLSDRERQILLVPKIGSAVTLGSLSGDYNDIVVIQVDEVESITINGGKLGGLVNIQALTDKINEVVDAFNRHTHLLAPGAIQVGQLINAAPVKVPVVATKATRLKREDYEDNKIKH